MKKSPLILSVLLSLIYSTPSHTEELSFLLRHTEVINFALPQLKNLDWKVGDFQVRQVKKGFIRGGRLESWVDREEGNAFWLLNDLKIIFKKKKHIEILIERKSGKILRYIVDGEEKEAPDITNLEKCIEISEGFEKVKVPAGTFESRRSVVRCPDDSIALWINDKKVNMNGHIRQAILTEDEDPNKYEYLIELVEFGKRPAGNIHR